MTERDLREDERRFVLEHIAKTSAGDEVVWMNWVSKRKRKKVQPRLLVVTKYKVLSIKRGGLGGGKSVQREGYILDLVEILCGESGQLKFGWKDFWIEVDTDVNLADQALTAVRLHLTKMTCGFPEHCLPKLSVPASRLVALPEIDFGPAEGFCLTYEAMCNYFGGRPSTEVVTLVSDTWQSGNTVLDFSECPGIELKMAYTFDLLPVIASLRHNKYFTCFILKNVARKDVVAKIADCMARNTLITKVVCSGVDAAEGFAEFGAALRFNKAIKLTILDFSHNKIGDRGMLGLAEGLKCLEHPLTKLNLADTGLTSKGVATLFQTLAENWTVSEGMVELDISSNKFDETGTQALAMWLQNLGLKNPSLRRLSLARTDLEIFAAIQAAKSGILRTLTDLDMSGNTIDRAAAQAIGVAIKEPDSVLSRIHLSNAKINGESLEVILGCIAQNPNIREMRLDLSMNGLGSDGAAALAKTVVVCNNLHTINVRDNKFKPEAFLKVVDAFILNNSLRIIDLGVNFTPKKGMREMAQSLALLIQKHPTLQLLNICGDGKMNISGPDLEPFLQAVATAPRLLELDVSANGIGDKGATTLADALRKNNVLQVLKYDDNNITLGGFQSLKAMLSAGNTSLCNLGYPRVDIERVVSKNKDQRMRDKIADTMAAITEVLKANRANNSEYQARMELQAASEESDDVGLTQTFRTMRLTRASAPGPGPGASNGSYGSYGSSNGGAGAGAGGGGGVNRYSDSTISPMSLPPPPPPDMGGEYHYDAPEPTSLPPVPMFVPPPPFSAPPAQDSPKAHPPPMMAPPAQPVSAYPSAYPMARPVAAPSPYVATTLSTGRGNAITPGFAAPPPMMKMPGMMGAPPPLAAAPSFSGPPPTLRPLPALGGAAPPMLKMPPGLSAPPPMSAPAYQQGKSPRPGDMPPPPPPPADDDDYGREPSLTMLEPPPAYDDFADGGVEEVYDEYAGEDDPPPPPPDDDAW